MPTQSVIPDVDALDAYCARLKCAPEDTEGDDLTEEVRENGHDGDLHVLSLRNPEPRSVRWSEVNRISFVVGLMLIAGCSLEPTPPVNPPAAPISTSTSSTAPSTTAPTTTTPVGACPEGDVMLSEGQLIRTDRSGADGTRITGISWRTTGQCQVVSITFATEDGAPATTVPSLDARLLRSEGVLRIATDATSSVIANQQVEEGLIDQLFVPVTSEGTRFIDLVLNGPLLARARVLSSPARLEIEIQPGGQAVGRPLIADSIVIVEPRSDAVATPTIDVTGYVSGPAVSLNLSVSLGSAIVKELPVELGASPGIWTAFDIQVQMENIRYDNLRITRPDGTVVAGMPFSP